MIQLAFICEGKTERNFVEYVIAPYLKTKGIESIASEIGQEYLHPGGNVSLARIERDVENHLQNCDYVTTIVDFYGMAADWKKLCDEIPRGTSSAEKACLAESVALTHAVQTIQLPGVNIAMRFIPNVLMHEFEGLLFTSPDCIAKITRSANRSLPILQRIASEFPTLKTSILDATPRLQNV